MKIMPRVAAFLTLGVVLAALPSSHAFSAMHPTRLSDIFKMENVASVAFDPQGQRVIFERIPPYLQMSSYGLEARQTATLFVYDLNGKTAAHPLMEKHGAGSLPDSVEGMWIGGFSPQGTRLAVYWLEDGATHTGVYDFSAGQLVRFSFTPDMQFYADSLVWLSEDEIIYSAMPAGQEPPVPDWRRVGARNLAKAWEDAWHGAKSTASVLRSVAGEPDRSVPEGALLRVNARTGATRLIGTGRYSGFSLSPDGRYLAALQMGRLRQMNPDKPVNWVENPAGVRKQAVLFDLVSGKPPVALFPEGEPTDNSFAWSATGDRLAFCTARTGSASGGIYYLFDAVSGKRTAIPHRGLDLTSQRERGWQDIPDQAVPFGKGIAVPARAQADPNAPPLFTQKDVFPKGLSRIDWYEIAPDGTSRNLTAGMKDVSAALVSMVKGNLFVSGDGGIWRIGADRRPKNVTAGLPYKVSYSRMFLPEGGGESRDISAGVAVARAVGAAEAPYVFVDLASGHSTTLAVPSNSGRMLAVSTAAHAAVMRGTGDAAWSLSLVSDRREQPAPFWVFNQHLSDVQAPKKVTLSYALANGKTVQAEALLPPDWTPGRHAPAAVYIYPNTSRYIDGSYYGFVNTYDDALLATAGYVVLFPYSSEPELRTTESPLGNWATLVLPAVDALVKAGYADPDRISAYGISQGSWSTLALLTQTDRFKAAMAGYGSADFVSQYGSMGIGRRLWPDDLFALGDTLRYEATAGTYPLIGAALVDDPERYIRASPIFAARKIQTPLLLLHTDLDINFPMSQFDEMFLQMVRLRKEAEYVRYWGEEHGLKSPANLRDQWARMLAWFDRWSDVSRDAEGHIAYDGGQVRSRRGAAARDPEEFLHLDWLFGK